MAQQFPGSVNHIMRTMFISSYPCCFSNVKKE